ncbi:hypothetical protein [Plantactinospora sonchi]|uniref:Uncharacterized protein n=1 Tax=Plantactinospora sonchi TaxID=1544735 RepID=A0ABU7S4N0_9ACTN
MPASADPHLAQLDTDERWRALTTLPAKLSLYRDEVSFRESWRIAQEVLGTQVLTVLQQTTLLTLRPEAILARKADDCLEFLRRHDFAAIHAERLRYDRNSIRDLWRYQWNVAQLDSIEVSDLVHYRAPALMLVLRDLHPAPGTPASLRLTAVKGTSDPTGRTPRHLRSVLGAPNRVLVVIHAPDEPLDVVRELGVLFDRAALRRVYATMCQEGADTTPRSEIDDLYRSTERYSLRVDKAIDALRRELRVRASIADPGRLALLGRVDDRLSEAEHGGHLDWRGWVEDLDNCGLAYDSWPSTVVASHHVEHTLPGVRPLIPETGRRGWLAGDGLLLPRQVIR